MKLILLFFAGLFLANGCPHFFHGISGKRFHSPFAKPFVKGLSSAISNVLWGLANFIIGIVLVKFSKANLLEFDLNFQLFVAGFILASVGLSYFFAKIDKNE